MSSAPILSNENKQPCPEGDQEIKRWMQSEVARKQYVRTVVLRIAVVIKNI